MLLAAIGRDGNNQMYPVAWAVVEGETNDSWEWFMENLKASLNISTGEGWMFMSDQQKGLLNVVAKLFPKAEHRNCARHIYQHWKRDYKGDELNMHFWNAVNAYCVVDYNLALKEMAMVSPNSVDAFKALNPTTFCRAFLKTDTMCDIVVSNMAETFNGWIVNARAKHILYMLEDIRCQIMERLCKKRKEMLKWNIICPRVQEKLEIEKDEARNCTAKLSDMMLFQVSHNLDILTVDMEKKTCTCRKWDLTGIPCCHAVSCAFYLRHKAEEYVGDYLRTTTYAKSYQVSIATCVGEKHWPEKESSLQPPLIKVGPGRPRKNRRNDPYEDLKRPGKLTRHGQAMHCSVCRSSTHTKRKCPDKNKVPDQPAMKRCRGRPMKTNEAPNSRENQGDIHNRTAVSTRREGRGRGIGGRGARGNRGDGRRNNVPRGYGVCQP